MASTSSATPKSSVEMMEEVINRKWKIGNALRAITEARKTVGDVPLAFLQAWRRLLFVFGSGDKSGKPRQKPIRAEASVTCFGDRTYFFLCLLDRPLDAFCSIKIIDVSLSILPDEEGTSEIDGFELKDKDLDWTGNDFHYELFDKNEVDKYVDKDGEMCLGLKMKVAITRPSNCSITSSDPKCSQSQVCNDFEELLTDSSVADFEVKVCGKGGKTFSCHKAVLSARSPVFRRMFESNMKESTENFVEVVDISAKTMGQFLSFLYCGRFQDDSWVKSLPKLVVVADKYCVKSLLELCDERLIESVTNKNALAVGKLAERLGLSKALKDIQDFTAMNIREITFDSCEDSEEED